MFKSLVYHSFCFISLSWAAPTVGIEAHATVSITLKGGAPGSPSVTIKNGTVIGSSFNGIESFKGIPFAQQPVGNRRLRPPQSLTTGFSGGTFDASGAAGACPQFAAQFGDLSGLQGLGSEVLSVVNNSPLGQSPENQTESCLTINVQRPAGITANDRLPVVYWIFGGGFETGWSNFYDGSSLIQSSMTLGEPIVYVAVNYRVGGFGFLGGKELAAEGATNLGLRDQRLGLHWVQENIGAFGGDSDKVTIWGESAGSISVADQLIINNGDHTYNGKPLFRAAIMDSGSITPVANITSPKPQAIYDTIVANSPCAHDATSLDCLRGLDYQDFLGAASSVPGIFSYNSLDLSYLPRPDSGDNFFSRSPEMSVFSGKFARVPLIIGDQEDEGTLFSLVQGNLTSNDDLIDYITTYVQANNPNGRQLAAGLIANYPDDVLLGQPDGSPFRTGILNNVYPQFKRLAAVLGDLVFTMTRRIFLNSVESQGVKCWSYLGTYLYGTPVIGTVHGSDVILGFLAPSNSTIPTRSIHTYYLNFFNHMDPNGGGNIVPPLISWPQWTNESPQLLNFELLENSIEQDTFREGAYEYYKARISQFHI